MDKVQENIDKSLFFNIFGWIEVVEETMKSSREQVEVKVGVRNEEFRDVQVQQPGNKIHSDRTGPCCAL